LPKALPERDHLLSRLHKEVLKYDRPSKTGGPLEKYGYWPQPVFAGSVYVLTQKSEMSKSKKKSLENVELI
jgi:hypothetical protein